MNIVLLLVDGCRAAGGWCPEPETRAPVRPRRKSPRPDRATGTTRPRLAHLFWAQKN
jgi:hypothetical protein